ncbi:MAG: carboxypeptidase regulatory-like domain-containing protein, partial [Bryobacterales bacterium]|nr:carboxypeptidase regulatory-like domain-containing protein [Bryobacterales bacterium]
MSGRRKVRVIAVRVACLCLLVSGLGRAQAQFGGVVVSSTQTPVVGARVLLKRGEGPAIAAFTDAQGRFQISLASAGRYLVTVEREGYFPIREQAVEIVPGQGATLVLEPVREIRESIEVSAAPVGVDMATTASQQGVTANEIANIPYPNTNDFRQALRVIPGVVRDNRGGLHINGGAEDQVMYTLNGFNVTDPLTGR